ncbi:hypothetical protein [Bradyrhizobium sp.]|uniref:hypothetical protein n=1 Tax=Bradyrhizobium sp. TaxID=376 RepID=UPI002734105B|nr:hypothetical protein [Bradyrhizobium sp.]MDP3689712.1 hypothetical protein [Bradyrhizobium sp.]
MPRTGSNVPYGADQTVYLVVDRQGRQGAVYCEIEIERTDTETIVADLLAGQFHDPVRVTAYNTLEHWSRDISSDIAAEIQTRCDIEGTAVPGHVEDFVRHHINPVPQNSRRSQERAPVLTPVG